MEPVEPPGPKLCQIRHKENGEVVCEVHGVHFGINPPGDKIRDHIDRAKTEWYQQKEALEVLQKVVRVEEKVDWGSLAKDPSKLLAKVMEQSLETRFDYLSAVYEMRFPNGDTLHVHFGAKDLEAVHDKIVQIREALRKGDL